MTNLGFDVKKGRSGTLRRHVSERECIELELSRRNVPASLLRWDVPIAIFNGGRCVSPATHERSLYAPEVTTITNDGYITEGFVGHNVTASGIGWVLGDVSRRKRGGAFGHDAWTLHFRFSGTGANVDAKLRERAALGRCGESATEESSSSAAYAKARLAARSTSSFGYTPGSMRQIAASYKRGFVNTSWNCFHSQKDWDGALADQRAYAMLVAQRQEKLPGECTIWGSLYNQVHVGWNASDIRAIFYVNDTLSATRPAPTASTTEAASLLKGAVAAAWRAYDDALITQRAVFNRTGLMLPVVRFDLSPECTDARPLAKRIDAAKLSTNGDGRRGDDGTEVFQVPEPALREMSTLLGLTVKKRKHKRGKSAA